ncbi:hypothetical protein JHD46_08170 [Sulfurimonas sp. SAG-AH-194-C20]|nr:hypothetical protein [Sulfurimonas sp. SAG-AH-194-C20]MDF1879610.1 hypothetical protein [Sulfurimonas sp. SAG-AH-194-C20]
MSDGFMFVNKKNQYDVTDETLNKFDNIVSRFTHELVTDIGSCVFDKDYGTTFSEDLGTIINIYKVDFFLQKAFALIKDKHSVDSVTLVDSKHNHSDGFLDLSITVEAIGRKAVVLSNLEYNGESTTDTIVEN